MSATYGLIFAGGRGERLGGVRKADLRVGGVRLLDRVAHSFGSTTLPLVVAGGSTRDDYVVISDLADSISGPLAGLAAAVEYLRADNVTEGLIISATVDTPMLPENYAEVMRAAIGTAPAAYVTWGADFYPPNAIWQLAAIQGLPERARNTDSRLGLKKAHSELGSVAVDWQGQCVFNPFGDIDRFADLLAFQRRFRSDQFFRNSL
jgi:molybdopterin-guanine dinucleotide biosynthesis protein A